MRSLVARVLRVPQLYGLLQRGVAPARKKRVFVDDYLQVGRGARILDVGCGPGYLLDHLPDVDYVGFDPNPAYIAAAEARYGERGRFLVAGIDHFDPGGLEPFDVVVAKGVLHHLSDDQVVRVAELAQCALRPGGRLVTLDPAVVPSQGRIAHLLVTRDRGEYVRAPDAYRRLVASRLPDVTVTERDDLLRVPYNHVVLTASP